MTTRAGAASRRLCEGLALCLALAAPTALPGVAGPAAVGGPAAPLIVNGTAVAPDEYCWFRQQERAGAIQYCRETCGLDYGDGFWSRHCAGTTPLEVLQKRTIDRVIREKVEQLLFQELGLLDDVTWEALLKSLDDENRKRERVVKGGHAVPGPVRYDLKQYHGRLMHSLRIEARRQLARGRLAVSEDSVRAYYDRNREMFRTGETVTLDVIDVAPRAGSVAAEIRARADSAAAAILSRLQAGQAVEQLLRDYETRADVRVSHHRAAALDHERLAELFSGSNSAERILALSPGKCLSVAESTGTVHVVMCVSRTPGETLPYEAARERARARCVDREYEALIDGLTARAEIRVNRRALDDLPGP